MENNRPLGPAASAARRPLSPSRLAILDQLRGQPEPLTQAALVRATGLHTNTVRDHLEGLLRAGLARRTLDTPVGRGRPAWLYETTPEGEVDADMSAAGDYAGLASALAGTLAESSPDPRSDAVRAGTVWGHELVRNRGVTAESPEGARDRVVSLLYDLGYAPRRDDAEPTLVRLTHCPLLAAAHRHADVVCAVHLGIVRGALTEHGVSSDGVTLEPFAEPGACLLHVPPHADASA